MQKVCICYIHHRAAEWVLGYVKGIDIDIFTAFLVTQVNGDEFAAGNLFSPIFMTYN